MILKNNCKRHCAACGESAHLTPHVRPRSAWRLTITAAPTAQIRRHNCSTGARTFCAWAAAALPTATSNTGRWLSGKPACSPPCRPAARRPTPDARRPSATGCWPRHLAAGVGGADIETVKQWIDGIPQNPIHLRNVRGAVLQQEVFMIKNTETHYNKIGQAILEAVNQDFDSTYVRIEMLDNIDSIGLFFERKGEYFYLNEGLDDLLSHFREFYNDFKEEIKYSWTSATFKINSSGKMDLELGYDDISDFSMSSKRRDKWMKKYLDSRKKINW
ncbi:immunity protein YezG family protein [Vandammella animalimorsus]|uniref:immunity protein YezG family protein n=1 Tax=Vandammella animalimorsus TaxID=2029117 RepID=UPI001178B5FC|nr:immunity protein YezG family protein [Vandammella animalimorsus]